MRTLVAIPTYNEAGSIGGLAEAILAQDPTLDVLVIDDGSPDGTAELVEQMATEQPRLSVLRRAGKLGLGSAYMAGFRYGLDHDYDQVFTMDGDGSHDPIYLPAMLEALREADMVIGSRYVPGGGIANWRLHRRVLSSFANFYTRLLLRIPQRDCTSGYRGYRREVLLASNPFAVRSSGYSFLEEMVWRVHRAGFQIAEIPIVFTDRHLGASKIDRSEIFKAAWHVLATALGPVPTAQRDAARMSAPQRKPTPP